ncbi:hypothetical protein BDE02_03G053700 [Populus trichocarpa]|nr:hypothetical protein BDE02_03G053700 [Populus trichocarpa]
MFVAIAMKMPSCQTTRMDSLGALNVKLSKLDFGGGKFGNLQQRSGVRVWMGRVQLQYAGVAISHKSRKAFRCCGSASEAEWTTKETTSLGLTSQLIPNSSEVESLVTEICNTTSIAEFELKVGFFRRSRTIKGKRAPPSCKEKQIIKEGQVLCYIEQLGGELPIESDISGEVIKILQEDGEPVGYGDALIAILPSFPGIKKLQ